MPRNKEPIDLVVAKGKKNLTKSEIEKRRAQELRVDLKDIIIPEYLPTKLHAKFTRIAGKLLLIGIMTELDEDALARYLLNEEHYLKEVEMLRSVLNKKGVDDVAKAQSAVSNAYRIVHMAAAELGLSIISRAKLVMPGEPDEVLPDL